MGHHFIQIVYAAKVHSCIQVHYVPVHFLQQLLLLFPKEYLFSDKIRGGVESIALFDSKPKIVWEINASEYYVCEISEGRARSLIEKMRVGGTKTPSGEAQGESSTSVWIILGNGQVITPHLELTSGNVGYGELFDYEKEYEPSEDFSNLLIDTVS